jgi:hypothetical protein
MATYTTYDQVGVAEDVSDIITDISPTDCPLYSTIRSEKASARIIEWQEDSLAAASNNAQVEGADPSMATLSATTMRTNNCQIMSKAFQVSATADAIKTYGRAKETAYQLGKALKEIKRDVERAFIGVDNAAVTGNASGPVAREMASATQQIVSGNQIDAGSNATDALTEAKLLDAHQACYTAGGDPSVLYLKPADSEIVAGFTGSSGRTRNFNDESKTLTNVVDVLVNPYGTLKVVLNRHQLTTHAFLLDPTMWRTAVLRPFSRTLLSKSGDSDRHFIVGELSLKHMNFSASACVTGLS